MALERVIGGEVALAVGAARRDKKDPRNRLGRRRLFVGDVGLVGLGHEIDRDRRILSGNARPLSQVGNVLDGLGAGAEGALGATGIAGCRADAGQQVFDRRDDRHLLGVRVEKGDRAAGLVFDIEREVFEDELFLFRGAAAAHDAVDDHGLLRFRHDRDDDVVAIGENFDRPAFAVEDLDLVALGDFNLGAGLELEFPNRAVLARDANSKKSHLSLSLA